MEILEEYEFRRPSRSRYEPVVVALCDDDAFAVLLRRGDDFPVNVTLDSVQGAVAQQVRLRGKRARTFRESDDVLIVSLYADGPARPRKRGRAKVTA
jgi:hypothetical protein